MSHKRTLGTETARSETADTIADLQSRLSFQEDTLQALNGVIAEQDKTILRLQQQVQHLNTKFNDLALAFEEKSDVVQDKPPHY